MVEEALPTTAGKAASSGISFFDDIWGWLEQPKGIAIACSALLVLFAGFWLLMHLLVRPETPAGPMAAGPSPTVSIPLVEPGAEPKPPVVPPPIAPPPMPIAPVVVTTPPPTSRPAVALTTSTAPSRPLPRALPALATGPTDEQVGQAIATGVNYLITQFDPTTHCLKKDVPYYPASDPLAVYALLQCGQTITDDRLNPLSPFMTSVLDAMKKLGDFGGTATYGVSLHASALALAGRPRDRGALDADVNWLLSAERDGAYAYTMPDASATSVQWDNSNSQYGVYGTWSAAEAGVAIPRLYWEQVMRHWLLCQQPDGTFNYHSGTAPSLSMDYAGLTSLIVAHDYLADTSWGNASGRVDLDPRPAIHRVLQSLSRGDVSVSIDLNDQFGPYVLYGAARAGLASGVKFFGTHNWYPELAKMALAHQSPDGSFCGDNVNATCFCLLFLSRGRHPIMLNKLQYSDAADTHPRDASNLARYASRELEDVLNAQIVPIDHNWADWTDSPLLYLPAVASPKLSDDDVNRIRQFVLAGGLLFTHGDPGVPEFNPFAHALAARLFPDRPLTKLPDDHPLYFALYHLGPKPPLLGVSNGARLLMVHCPVDLARGWSQYDPRDALPAYQMGLNIFIYAAGKVEYHNRLDNTYLPEPSSPPTYTVHLARVRYNGNWDPEPFAWAHFSRQLQWQTGYALGTLPVNIANLTPAIAPIAHLTGTDALQLNRADAENLGHYVQQGGVLLIDACGGQQAFAQSEAPLLAAAFDSATPMPLDPSHPLLRHDAPGMMELPQVLTRPPGVTPQPPAIVKFGRGHVIVTPLDLTCALLDTQTQGITGYRPSYAELFCKNLLFWTLDGQKDPESTPAPPVTPAPHLTPAPPLTTAP